MRFKCPACSGLLKVDRSSCGATVTCSICQREILVPEPPPMARKKIKRFALDASHSQSANYIAGVVSLFIPGLGQMFQGRDFHGLGIMFLTPLAWILPVAFIVTRGDVRPTIGMALLGVLALFLPLMFHMASGVNAARHVPGKWEWIDDTRSDDEFEADMLRKRRLQIAAGCAVGFVVVALQKMAGNVVGTWSETTADSSNHPRLQPSIHLPPLNRLRSPTFDRRECPTVNEPVDVPGSDCEERRQGGHPDVLREPPADDANDLIRCSVRLIATGRGCGDGETPEPPASVALMA